MMRQYFVAVVLPNDLDKKILELKQMMLDRYECRVALRSPSHITLVPPFWFNEEKESLLLKALSPILSQHSFDMFTDGFASFPPKTIFIALKKNSSLEALKDATTSLLLVNEIPDIIKETRPFVPHITIANRDLHKKSYYEAWEYFREKEFKASWKVESVCVLRHNGEKWEISGEVMLGN